MKYRQKFVGKHVSGELVFLRHNICSKIRRVQGRCLLEFHITNWRYRYKIQLLRKKKTGDSLGTIVRFVQDKPTIGSKVYTSTLLVGENQ
jgi:hypothetical protein